MAAKKNTDTKCNITIKNVPCELKVYFTQQANDNERSLSKEIINILKQIKASPKHYQDIFSSYLIDRHPIENEETKKWRESQNSK